MIRKIERLRFRKHIPLNPQGMNTSLKSHKRWRNNFLESHKEWTPPLNHTKDDRPLLVIAAALKIALDENYRSTHTRFFKAFPQRILKYTNLSNFCNW